jgi:hypothetical protein
VLQTATQIIAPLVTTVEQLAAPVLTTAGQVVAPIASAAENVIAPVATSGTASQLIAGVEQDVAPAIVAPALASSEPLTPGTTTEANGVQPTIRMTEAIVPKRGSSAISTMPATPVTDSFASLPSASQVAPNAREATASPSRESQPFGPARPHGFPASAGTAGAGGGSTAPLFAALAAILLLAAPGLGRRLRLRLAPRPLPILATSLERPG